MIQGIGFDLQFTIVYLRDFTLGRWFVLFDKGFERVMAYLKELGVNYEPRRLVRILKRTRNKYFAITITKEQAYYTEEILGDTFKSLSISLSPEQFQNCLQLYHSIEIPAWKPYPNAQKTLKRLAERYELALLTNANEYVAREILKLNDLDTYFSYFYADIRKPRLKGFQQFKDDVNVAFPELCMVGDDIRADIEPAIKLKMKTIHTYRGYEYLQHHADLDIQPDKKVERFEDVPSAIEELDSS
jgi:HAD superfamily hydrolase (TIGR01509 family)